MPSDLGELLDQEYKKLRAKDGQIRKYELSILAQQQAIDRTRQRILEIRCALRSRESYLRNKIAPANVRKATGIKTLPGRGAAHPSHASTAANLAAAEVAARSAISP